VIEEKPGFRPLYRQVYDFMVKQLTDGAWKPGEALPSEQALAGQLGVSQGTVRKALDVMAQEQLLDRQQGKGTFVSTHTQERALFRFFRLRHAGGGSFGVPSSEDEVVERRRATDGELSTLAVDGPADVYEIRRTRLLDGTPAIFETVIVPAARFPGLDTHQPLPNALYQLYQHVYGVNIVTADEELKADLAGPEDRARLKLQEGAPVLQIRRVALALDGGRAELRISRCDTRRFVYAVSLR
jgi:GntR family transcriptional regulator